MNEGIIRITIQIISSSVTNLLLILLLYRVFKPKYKSKLLYVTIFILSSTFVAIVNRILIVCNYAFLNSAFLFVYSCVLSKLLFNVSIKKVFLHNAAYIIVAAFIDFTSVLICSLITGESVLRITDDIKYVSMFNSFYCLIMVIVWVVYISIFGKNQLEEVKERQISIVTLYVLFAIFIEYSFAIRIRNPSDVITGIIILVGLFISAVTIVYFTNRIARMYKEHYYLDLMRNQNKIQLDHFNEISEKYEQSRVVIHDVKKHLEVLSSLSFSKDEKAVEYGKIIINQVDSLLGEFHCSNRILSIIMSQKILTAEKAGIRVETKIEDLLLDCIEDVDLTAIFANLWDNSIEACTSTNDTERYISVIVGRVNDFIVISFENTFDGSIKQNGGLLLSSKENHEGLGLSIVKASVEKYNGSLTMKHTDNIFNVEIVIPL